MQSPTRTIALMPLLGLLAAAVIPTAALAQESEETPPEVRVLTVTTFQLPAGEEGQKVMQFIDRVIAPQARNNPNVLSYRVAQHYWGSNSSELKLISEYADWASVEAPCGPPCETWAEANIPEEGTPEREEFDEQAQAWQQAFFAGHVDEIYTVNMSRAKN